MSKYTSDTIVQLDGRAIPPGTQFDLPDDHPLTQRPGVVSVEKAKASAKAQADAREKAAKEQQRAEAAKQ